MIKQDLFIVNFNSLYEILYEIKDNFSFNIKNYVSEDIFLKEFNIDLKNSLIISKSNNQPLLSKKIDSQNFLDLVLFPISINRLVELINIQLIKLKFSHQSKIIIKSYELDLNSKFISRDGLNLKLTEKEVKIILYLSESRTAHNIADLERNIWGYTQGLETHTVETHIHRLKKKVFKKFNDKNFIISEKSGYKIK